MKRNSNYRDNGRVSKRDEDLPGYPEYSEDEDIYLRGKEEKDIDPENILGRKKIISYSKFFTDNEDDESGSDLDVPGSELDDDLEMIGDEDEENNYYSLSDNNDDLEDLIE